VNAELEQMRTGRMAKWYVSERAAPQAVIGDISFSEIIRGPFQSCFLGYKIDGEFNGKGSATEMIKRAVEHVLLKGKLHRIEANVMPSNAPSIRVLEKCGFHREGFAEKYLCIDGRWEDHIHYVIFNGRT
jgi:[ribosomal protein S5]-alanine N-acetyltransferase